MYTSKNLSKWFVIVLLLVSCVVLAKPAFARSTDQTDGVIRYVKAGGNGDCSSWAQACELQTALFIATPGDQIWVAAGTYKPTTSSNRSASFQMKSGVAIYGGFPAEGGDETSRDWQLNKTYLSGDIGLPGNINDNCYHVVTAISVDVTGSLDGFYIVNGNANSSYDNHKGGGIYLSNAAPTLTNVTFSANTAGYGGGMYMDYYNSRATLTNVTFSANTAYSGGGMYNLGNATLTDVTFSANTATSNGGGMANWGNATLTDITFSANTAAVNSGGMYNSGNVTLTNVTFSTNTAETMGGMGNLDDATLTNVTFSANTATSEGGGMYNSGNATLTDVTFSDNIAMESGGGMYNWSGSATLTGVTFVANTATNSGGGMYNSEGGVVMLTNVTFSDNIATYNGGGIYIDYYSSATLTGVTFIANTATNSGGGMYNSEDGVVMLTNVTFSANTANSGGGMHNYYSSATLTDVTFAANTAESGGGIYNSGNATLTDVTFADNTATESGGGMYNWGGSATLTNVTFAANTATYFGGGMYNWGDNATLTNVTFSANTAGDGGGMYNYYYSSATLTNVTFSENIATNSGGGMYNSNSSATLTNVTFSANTAGSGGGMYNDYQSSATLTNVTFSANTAESGGGIYGVGSNATLTNAILWGNSPDQIVGKAYVVTYSDIQGGYPGEGNINSAPLLGPLENNGGFTLTHALLEGSPAIDAGDISVCPPTDQRLFFRPVDGNGDGIEGCDMGAYEYGSYLAIYTINISTFGNGSVIKEPEKDYYDYGEVVTLTAIADPGWSFVGWGGDASGLENPLTLIMDKIFNIEVTFSQKYTINISTFGNGSVIKEPEKDFYNYGEVVTLTAIADPGWSFGGWGGDASGLENPLTLIIDKYFNIEVTFTQNEYTINISTFGNGSVIKEPEKDFYNYGEVVTLTAIADPGWSFGGWGGDASGLENPLILIIDKNFNIEVAFTQDEYTLSISINPQGQGTVTVTPIKPFYHYGDVVTLMANAESEWTFSHWSGDAEGNENPLSVIISGDTAIIANFTQIEYTLTTAVSPIGSGSITVSPAGPYHYNEVVTLTATPEPGWSFANWSGDAIGTTNPISITITGNVSVTAHFTQVEYTLTVTVDPENSGTVSLDPQQATYHYGDVIELTATPALGWSFTNWTGDATGTTSPVEVTITKNTNVTAHFTQNEYTLTVTVDPEDTGTVSLDPAQDTYHYGDVVELTATPTAGWSFANWTGDATGTANPVEVTITGDTNVTANFTQNEYTLTVTVDPEDSGTVSLDPAQDTYHYGDVVELTATPALGWSFTNWTGDASGTTNPVEITITGNTSVTANFAYIEYTLTVTVDPENSGTVSFDPDQDTYHYGDVVELTATPALGWSFTNWTGDASGTTNPVEVTITKNTNVTAHFTQNEYTLTVTVDPENSGTVSLDPDKDTYHYGDVVTLTATPALGWSFANWTGDATGTTSPVEVTITKNTNVTAHFTQNEYTLNVTVDPESSGTVSLDPQQATYHYGDQVTLTATPNPLWSFAGWSGDAAGSDNPLTITILGNTEIIANFQRFWLYLPLISR